MKYLVEISETYKGYIDDDNEYVFCGIDELGEKILEVIDCDDISTWKPIGSSEFIDKFNKFFGSK